MTPTETHDIIRRMTSFRTRHPQLAPLVVALALSVGLAAFIIGMIGPVPEMRVSTYSEIYPTSSMIGPCLALIEGRFVVVPSGAATTVPCVAFSPGDTKP